MNDLSDATADLLAEQRRARLEQCSITVVDTSSDGWNVCLDSISQESFDTEDDAWTYAYELASDMLDDGDWE